MAAPSRTRRARRAQFFAIDIVAGISFLLLLIFIYAAVANNFDLVINQREKSMQLSEAAQAALEQLVTTAGFPSNWDAGNFSEQEISSLGLASEPNVLDPGKVAAFFQAVSADANRSAARDMLGLNRPGYDFGLQVRLLNGTVLASFGSLPANATATSQRTSFAAENGETVMVKLTAWTKD